MAYEDLDQPDAPAAAPGRHWLSWTALAAVGLLVYELTTQPALGATMLCLKAGWRDLRTAVWLWRTDPNRGRGGACFWLYAASGLWKTALTGVAVFFTVSALSGLYILAQVRAGRGAANRPVQLLPPEVLLTGFLVALVGFGLSSLTSYLALVLALRHRVRLWLNAAVHQARSRNVWPPLFGRDNRIGRLFVTAALVMYFALGPMLILAAALVFRHALGWRLPPPVGVLVTATWVFAVGPGVSISIVDMKRRVAALRPSDCWGTDPLPDPDATDSDRWSDDFARRADPSW
jgi:hypothetical protein